MCVKLVLLSNWTKVKQCMLSLCVLYYYSREALEIAAITLFTMMYHVVCLCLVFEANT